MFKNFKKNLIECFSKLADNPAYIDWIRAV